jgi:murein DD-endopeptidase MepM/ murein hydrolase activator NlpD
LIAYYSGLAKEVSVKKGQAVESGKIIGVVDIVPSECSDDPHLHFAMKKNGKWASPLEIMGMLK